MMLMILFKTEKKEMILRPSGSKSSKIFRRQRLYSDGNVGYAGADLYLTLSHSRHRS